MIAAFAPVVTHIFLTIRTRLSFDCSAPLE
jgi:hypothetical protein